MTREAFEQYLAHRKKEDDSARTRNLDRASLVAFCNWCVETHRLASNPFEKIAKANEETDRRHERRALTMDEIHRLLAATRERPLREALTIRTGKNKGQLGAKVRPEVHAKRIRQGNERALTYSALIYTGLRKGELTSMTLAHLVLDLELAYLILKAKDEKGKRGAKLPLHPALAEAIQASLAEREAANGGPLPTDTPLFNVPPALSKIFNRDIVLAGIEKRDALGRVADVHCLRHTHASLLAQAGVNPSVAQKSMRHSNVKLTMGVYTHIEMGDVAKAVSLLPDLAMQSEEPTAPSTEKADIGANPELPFAPEFAPTRVQGGQNVTNPDIMSDMAVKKNVVPSIDVSACPGKRKGPLSSADNDPFGVGDTGLEPVTPSLSNTGRRDVSATEQGLAETCDSILPTDRPIFMFYPPERQISVSPLDTLMIMLEEKLQPIVDSGCLNLSMILTSENQAIHLDSTVLPNGFVFTQTQNDSG